MKITFGTAELTEAVENYARALMPNIPVNEEITIVLNAQSADILIGEVPEETAPPAVGANKESVTKTVEPVTKTEETISKPKATRRRKPIAKVDSVVEEIVEEEETPEPISPEAQAEDEAADAEKEEIVEEEEEEGADRTVQDVMNDMEGKSNNKDKPKKKKSIFI